MPVTSRLSATERRAAIIQAAIRLFSERGFRGTTTREIASAVGVSEPVLYQHFPSKRDLYTAIIETVMNREQYTEVERMLSHSEDEPRVLLKWLALEAVKWHRENEDYVRLIHYSALERHELADLANQAHEGRFYEMVASYMERAMQAGQLRREDSKLVARLYLGMVGDACRQRILHSCDPLLKGDLETILPRMVDVFLDGLEVKQTT